MRLGLRLLTHHPKGIRVTHRLNLSSMMQLLQLLQLMQIMKLLLLCLQLGLFMLS